LRFTLSSIPRVHATQNSWLNQRQALPILRRPEAERRPLSVCPEVEVKLSISSYLIGGGDVNQSPLSSFSTRFSSFPSTSLELLSAAYVHDERKISLVLLLSAHNQQLLPAAWTAFDTRSISYFLQ
jgi:hypothetical protein